MSDPFQQRFAKTPKSAVVPRLSPAGDGKNPPGEASDLSRPGRRKAVRLDDFAAAPTSFAEVPAAAPNPPPEVRLFFNDDGLYVGWRIPEPEARKLRGQGPPDPLGRPDFFYDHVEILLDGKHDHRNFLLTDAACDGRIRCVRGTRLPGETPGDTVVREKETPRPPELRSAVHIGDDFWSGECVFPWSALGVEAPGPDEGRVIGFDFTVHRAIHPGGFCAWAYREFDAPYVVCNFGDLYLGKTALRVTELDPGRVVYGENTLRVKVVPEKGAALPAGLRVETKTLLPSEKEPVFDQATAAFRPCNGAPEVLEAEVAYRLSSRGRWAIQTTEPMRLEVVVRDDAGRTHYRTEFTFSYDHGFILTEDWGNPGVPREEAVKPAPDDPDFFEKLRRFYIARIPVFERTTADGRPVLKAADGSLALELCRPGALDRLREWLCGVFETDEDRLAGAAFLFHQRTVTRHSGKLTNVSAGSPLSFLRLGGGLCGARATALAAFLTLLKHRADGQPFEAHTLGMCGHVVVAVDVWPGYGTGSDYERRRGPDDWAWSHVVLDPDVGCLFVAADHRRLATLGDLRADREVSLRANFDHLRHGRDFYFGTDHQRLMRPSFSGAFPFGAPER